MPERSGSTSRDVAVAPLQPDDRVRVSLPDVHVVEGAP